MTDQWIVKEAVSEGPDLEALASELRVPEALLRILAQRGYLEKEAISFFLGPKLENLSDPRELPNMEEAVARIWRAIDNEESILVFGDYDVDGLTSSALLVRILTALGADSVDTYIPNRLTEGYGFSEDALKRCLSNSDPDLIITVDCGTNALDSVRYAHSQGVDTVVTDHHQPSQKIAAAVAVVNPKIVPDSRHSTLAGVGVAFKLCQALLDQGRREKRPDLEMIEMQRYSDLAAIGTIADVVPLRDENRILVFAGLRRLHKSRWKGLRELKKICRVRVRRWHDLKTYHIGYILGPRLNAAGRMGNPQKALDLLLANTRKEGKALAEELNELNSKRSEVEQGIQERAVETLDAYFNPESDYGLVLAGEGWHKGVLGIVASKIGRKYHRPTVVIGIGEDGMGHGSCRSAFGVNILEALKKCSSHLEKFGGHAMAAGLSIKASEIEAFRESFNCVISEALADVDLSPKRYIDDWLKGDEISWRLLRGISKMEPFGIDNLEPVWGMRNLKYAMEPQVVGENHLRFKVTDGENQFDAIAFGLASRGAPPEPFDLVFNLRANRFRGEVNIQMNVKDFRPSE